MMKAYSSNDPYIEFAKQAGVLPDNATKHTHPEIRERFKKCSLAVLYGMGEQGLAKYANCTKAEAKYLLQLHKATFKKFWQWQQQVLDSAFLNNKINTAYGWNLHLEGEVNPRTIRNFPMQANGAEIMRMAAILLEERGVEIVATVHDAFLIQAPIEVLDKHIAITQKSMEEAGAIVLNGFKLMSGIDNIAKYPENFIDKRGQAMFARIMKIINEKV
jgi:DNA polymerase I-like protein with 3'-5' exonuclease and polymerase domains